MTQMTDTHSPRFHRSLFLSDTHLGAVGARPDLLLRLLEQHQAQTYLLVGDILDLWHPSLPLWGAAHQAVIDHLHARHRAGAEIIYVRGNHDDAPDQVPMAKRLPVPAQSMAMHVTAQGRRLLVLHGDEADARLFRLHILTRLGSVLDQGLRALDRCLNWALTWVQAHSNPARRSPIEWVLSQLNAALYPTRAHEKRLIAMAREYGADGIVCGHYHIAALHDHHGLTYANCGDWTDSFTALSEDFNGNLQLIGGRAAFAALHHSDPAGVMA